MHKTPRERAHRWHDYRVEATSCATPQPARSKPGVCQPRLGAVYKYRFHPGREGGTLEATGNVPETARAGASFVAQGAGASGALDSTSSDSSEDDAQLGGAQHPLVGLRLRLVVRHPRRHHAAQGRHRLFCFVRAQLERLWASSKYSCSAQLEHQ